MVKRERKKIFILKGNLQICKICGELFDESIYRLKKTIHHIDENKKNNDLDNLMIIHFKCHIRLHRLGKHHTQEAKEKIGKAKKGKPLSKEHKKKIGENNSRYWKGKRGKNHPAFGHYVSQDAKEKISKAHEGKKTKEHITRGSLSRKIGKENYAKIKDNLFWDGKELVNFNGLVEKILRNLKI